MKKRWSLIRGSVQSNKDTGWFAQGECYRHGYGMDENLDMDIQSYKRATQVGIDADGRCLAHYALGTMYEAGYQLDVQCLDRSFITFNTCSSFI